MHKNFIFQLNINCLFAVIYTCFIHPSSIPLSLMCSQRMISHSPFLQKPFRAPLACIQKFAGMPAPMQIQRRRCLKSHRTKFAQIFSLIRMDSTVTCQQMLIDKLCIAMLALKNRIDAMSLHVMLNLLLRDRMVAQFTCDLVLCRWIRRCRMMLHHVPTQIDFVRERFVALFAHYAAAL